MEESTIEYLVDKVAEHKKLLKKQDTELARLRVELAEMKKWPWEHTQTLRNEAYKITELLDIDYSDNGLEEAASKAVEEITRLRGEVERLTAQNEKLLNQLDLEAKENEYERHRAEQAEAERDKLKRRLDKIHAWFEKHDSAIEIHNGAVLLFELD